MRRADGRANDQAIATSSNARSGNCVSITTPYAATSSPAVIRPSSASRAPYATTPISRSPGRTTWTAAISAHDRALRTAAARTSCDACR